MPYEIYQQGEYDKASEIINDLVHNLIPTTGGSVNSDPFWDNSARDFLLGLLMIMLQVSDDVSNVAMHNIVLLKNYFKATSYDGYNEKNRGITFYEKLPKSSLAYLAMGGLFLLLPKELDLVYFLLWNSI